MGRAESVRYYTPNETQLVVHPRVHPPWRPAREPSHGPAGPLVVRPARPAVHRGGVRPARLCPRPGARCVLVRSARLSRFLPDVFIFCPTFPVFCPTFPISRPYLLFPTLCLAFLAMYRLATPHSLASCDPACLPFLPSSAPPLPNTLTNLFFTSLVLGLGRRGRFGRAGRRPDLGAAHELVAQQ